MLAVRSLVLILSFSFLAPEQIEVVWSAGVLVGFLVALSRASATVLQPPAPISWIVKQSLSLSGWISPLAQLMNIQLISLSLPFPLPVLLLVLFGGPPFLAFFVLLMSLVIPTSYSLPILLPVPFG